MASLFESGPWKKESPPEIVPSYKIDLRQAIREEVEEAEKGFQPSENARSTALESLNNQRKEILYKVAEEWCKRNKDLIKSKGYDPTIEDKERRMAIFDAMGGEDILMRNKEYENFRNELWALSGAIHALEKKDENDPNKKAPLKIGEMYLILYQLDKMAEEKEKRLQEIKNKPQRTPEEETELNTLEGDQKSLFEIRKEFAEKIMGIKSDKEWEERRKNSGSTEELEEYKEKEIKKLAQGPKQAKEGIKGFYKRIMNEWAEEEIGKKIKEKEAENLEKIEKRFSKEGIDGGRLFNTIDQKREEISSDPAKAFRQINKILENFAFPILESDWNEYVREHGEKKGFETAKKTRIGFLSWIIELLAWIISKAESAGSTTK